MLLFDWKLEIWQCCSAYMYSFEVYLSILSRWTLPILTPACKATQTIFIEHVSRYFNSLYRNSFITCVKFEYWTFVMVWTCTSYFSLKRSVVESVTCQRVATSLPATISQHLQSHARLYRYSQIHRHIYRDVLQQFVTVFTIKVKYSPYPKILQVSNASVVLASIVERWKEIDQFTFVFAVSLSFNHFLVAFLVYPMGVYTMLRTDGWGLGNYWCTFTAYCTSYFEVSMFHKIFVAHCSACFIVWGRINGTANDID